jgi:hypothetical protein
MQSQCKQILAYLKKGRVVTPESAYRLFSCLRLSGRIYELRQRGYRIHGPVMKLPSGRRCSVYSL